MNDKPVGLVVTVTETLAAKFAVSLIGACIVTVAGLLVPVYEPLPVPDHPVNEYPVVGVADIENEDSLLTHSLRGLTVPLPVPTDIVNWYWVVKFAV